MAAEAYWNDHFGVRYRYANGAILVSTCRQIDGSKPLVDEALEIVA